MSFAAAGSEPPERPQVLQIYSADDARETHRRDAPAFDSELPAACRLAWNQGRIGTVPRGKHWLDGVLGIGGTAATLFLRRTQRENVRATAREGGRSREPRRREVQLELKRDLSSGRVRQLA